MCVDLVFDNISEFEQSELLNSKNTVHSELYKKLIEGLKLCNTYKEIKKFIKNKLKNTSLDLFIKDDKLFIIDRYMLKHEFKNIKYFTLILNSESKIEYQIRKYLSPE